MPKYLKKSKPRWTNLKNFKPWSSIREKLRDKFTCKNSAKIHEIADENHTEDINLSAPRFWRCNFCSKHISGEPLRIKYRQGFIL